MSWLKRLVSALFARAPDPSQPTRSERPTSDRIALDVAALSRALGTRIRTSDLFVQALLHRSYHQRTDEATLSNERLEFLGDSILNLVVGEHLYLTLPQAPEGELTRIRSQLVNKKALAAYAAQIGLPRFILMSQSAAQTVGKGMDTIMADTFEAIIAAVYLDSGYAEARSFVQRQVLGAIKRGEVVTDDDNYKSMLLEYAQAKGLGVPRYTVLRQAGPDHDRTFTVEVLLGSSRRGTGSGKNKKEAEQAAARQALRDLL
ncbi:MAG: ribonuclease III [Anaerolineae bacterium]